MAEGTAETEQMMAVDIESQRRFRPVTVPENPVHALWLILLALFSVMNRLVFLTAKAWDQPIEAWGNVALILMLIIAAGSAYRLYRMAKKAMPAVE